MFCPGAHGEFDRLGKFELEVRQVFDASEFRPEIFPPGDAARVEALREELQKRAVKPWSWRASVWRRRMKMLRSGAVTASDLGSQHEPIQAEEQRRAAREGDR